MHEIILALQYARTHTRMRALLLLIRLLMNGNITFERCVFPKLNKFLTTLLPPRTNELEL